MMNFLRPATLQRKELYFSSHCKGQGQRGAGPGECFLYCTIAALHACPCLQGFFPSHKDISFSYEDSTPVT